MVSFTLKLLLFHPFQPSFFIKCNFGLKFDNVCLDQLFHMINILVGSSIQTQNTPLVNTRIMQAKFLLSIIKYVRKVFRKPNISYPLIRTRQFFVVLCYESNTPLVNTRIMQAKFLLSIIKYVRKVFRKPNISYPLIRTRQFFVVLCCESFCELTKWMISVTCNIFQYKFLN